MFDWANEDDFAQRREQPPADWRARFLCVSDIGDMQDVETIVWAAKLAEDAPVKVTVLGGGVGEERAKKIAVAFDVRNVEFHEPVPPHEMAEAYASADFSLVTGKDLPNSRVTIPAQFHNSLVAGLPVVTTMQGDLRGLVEDLGLGFTANVEDAESLATAMRSAAALAPTDYDGLRLHVRDTYHREFSVQAGLNSIESALLQAVGSRQLQYR